MDSIGDWSEETRPLLAEECILGIDIIDQFESLCACVLLDGGGVFLVSSCFLSGHDEERRSSNESRPNVGLYTVETA